MAFLLDRQPWTRHSFFAPHNEHIVVLPVLITKVLLAVFGMTSATPEQVAMAAHAAGRRRRSSSSRCAAGSAPGLALIAAVLLLFLGSAWPVLLWPFENEFTAAGHGFGLGDAAGARPRRRRGRRLGLRAARRWRSLFGSLGLSFIVAAFVDVFLNRERAAGGAPTSSRCRSCSTSSGTPAGATKPNTT